MLYSGLVPLLLALLLDLVLGDPPNRYHPVAWMGTVIGLTRRAAPAPASLARSALRGGGGGGRHAWWWASLGSSWKHCCNSCLYPGTGWQKPVCSRPPSPAAVSCRPRSRCRPRWTLGSWSTPGSSCLWHLVSRDTATLTPSQVAAATVESVAENASDGIIAPLLFYALGGLPAALAYRFINTADAMLGYRDPEHEWLGKVPARLDDLVNLLPARLTAGLFLLVTWLLGGPIRRALRVWWRDAGQTASPNAGPAYECDGWCTRRGTQEDRVLLPRGWPGPPGRAGYPRSCTLAGLGTWRWRSACWPSCRCWCHLYQCSV